MAGQESRQLSLAEYRSRHFVLLSPPESYGARQAAQVARRLEDAALSLAQLTGLELRPDLPVHVLLTETPPGSAGEPVEINLPGRQLTVMYRRDSPAPHLERVVVEFLLGDAVGSSVSRAALLIDGLEGQIGLADRRGALTRLSAALGEVRRRGELPPLAHFRAGRRAANRQLYHQTAASFIAYLLSQCGPKAFLAFVAIFDPDNPDGAAELVLNKPFSRLEEEWLQTLKSGETPSGLLFFLRSWLAMLRPYPGPAAIALAALVAGSLFLLAAPAIYRLLIDLAILQRRLELLFPLLGALFVLLFLSAGAGILLEYHAVRLAGRVVQDLRMQLFARVQQIPLHYFTRERTAELVTRFTSDLETVESAVANLAVEGLMRAGIVTLSLTIIVSVDWRLGLLAAAGLLLPLAGPRVIGSRVHAAGFRRAEDAAFVAGAIREQVAALPAVKLFGLQQLVFHRFEEYTLRLLGSTVRLGFLSGLLGAAGNLASAFAQLTLLAAGVYLAVTGTLTVGALYMVIAYYAGNLLPGLEGMLWVVRRVRQAAGALQRVRDLLAIRPAVQDAPGAEPMPRPAREIQFRDVSFGYRSGQVSLSRVSLRIPVGSTVAVVGPEGSGKSTLLSLLLRLHDPTAGSIAVDGRDLRDLAQESYRSHIGAVLQDPLLFNTTIRENIRLGRIEAADGEVEAAARAAEVDDFVRSLPDGYETMVGERGSRLSGGQRQRIALARAILRNPAILAMDEATSALDPVTEAAINQTVARLGVGRTVIHVTHRLAAVTEADRIFVLDRGQVVEQGTHAELLAAGGLYRRLWEQQGGFLTTESGQVYIEAARLAMIPLFQHLEPEVLERLSLQFRTEEFGPGETVFNEGDVGDRFYLIPRGSVEMVTTGPAGEDQVLAVLRDGEYFGEMALLHGAPRNATIRTLAHSLFLTLDRDRFFYLLDTVPGLRMAIEQVVRARQQAAASLRLL
jgi:ATP-binding cassette, subfamily B, bacterial